jgi:hypothetical protein
MHVVGYVYGCDYWCADCLKKAGIDPGWDEVGAVFDDSEHDYPMHCGDCREFLETSLTSDGYNLLKQAYCDGSYRAPGGGPDEQFEEYMYHFADLHSWHCIWTFVGLMDPYGDILD